MSNLIKQANDSSFKTDVLESELPVLVDFWAPWCGPCKMIAPLLEEVAQSFEGKLQVVKVDVEANPSIASLYGIRSIPTLKLFNQGTSVATKVGAVNKAQLQAFIDANL